MNYYNSNEIVSNSGIYVENKTPINNEYYYLKKGSIFPEINGNIANFIQIFDETKCPICNNEAQISEFQKFDAILCKCSFCGNYLFEGTIQEYFNPNHKDFNKFSSSLFYYNLHRKPKTKKKLLISNYKDVSDEENPHYHIVLKDEILSFFPNNINERIDKILLNLSLIQPHIGANINLFDPLLNFQKIFFIDDNHKNYSERIQDFVDFLGSSNLILSGIEKAIPLSSKYHKFKISPLGWQRIEELQKNNTTIKQGFVAMSFNEKNKELREAIRKGIKSAGYGPRFIDEKFYNGQIVPEIFFEISRSDFLVSDLTDNRGGVYLEAGFALGLGKEVIFTVNDNLSNDESHKPHFDVAQMNQIRYKNISELPILLKDRIEATIGISENK